MGSVLKPSGSEVLRAANTCFHAPSLPRLLAFIERKMVSFSPRTFFLMMRLTPKQLGESKQKFETRVCKKKCYRGRWWAPTVAWKTPPTPTSEHL